MSKISIIAEAGVNHNGDMTIARQLIDVAADAGADIVKFQTFKANHLAVPNAAKAAYQEMTTDASESQYEMLKRLELKPAMHADLIEHCNKRNITFLSTPFDGESADLLVALGIKTIKIPSGEITNLPHLRHVAKLGKDVILSTGMATLEEVEEAVAVLTNAGLSMENISILHCNTQYPTPFADANLLAIKTLQDAFPACTIGYSDHTPSIECSTAAVALGAQIIEKHFTLDKSMDGPDHKASIEPGELKQLVSAIRNVESALGTGEKKPSPSETPNIDIARKYLVAIQPIQKGEKYTPQNIAARRTGASGVNPMRWDEVMNKTAPRDFSPMESISL